MSSLIKNLARQPFPWLGESSLANNVVISSRIRLARNLEGFFFPEKAEPDTKAEIVDTVFETLEKLPRRKSIFKAEVDNLKDEEKKLLLERKLLTFETLFDLECGIAFCRDESFSILINEEDHLHIQSIKPGLQLQKCWKTGEKLEEELASFLTFTFSNDLGYITSCPANVGTGLKASVYLDLTGAHLAGQLAGIIQSAKALGHAMCGENGEEGNYKGSRFLLSNRRTLGISEEEALKEFESFVKDIVAVEQAARKKIAADSPHRLLDHINRSFALLKNAWILSEDEAFEHLMNLRTGINMDLFHNISHEHIKELILYTGDAHLQNTLEKNALSEELDIIRAKNFKEKLAAK